jgi:calcineurin-like phosphoesterase family protein
MSKTTFLIGCTHFGHEKMYKFVDIYGNKVRPFENAKEADAVMLENWNSVVGVGDKVYVLGDVAVTSESLSILKKCNGKKVLIQGNHDNLSVAEYMKYFKDIRSSHKLDGEILSHIPIHLDSLWREKKNKNWLNIHAHLHQKYVTLAPNHIQIINGMRSEDPRYFSVCVERIGYKPISIDEIRNLTNPKSVV